MPNSYGKPTEKELHFKSLEAAAELAEKASLIALERGWNYERAAEYVASMDPDLCEMEVKGYVSEKESGEYSYTSLEAGNVLADKAKELMRAEGTTYDQAMTRICAKPENSELVKAYAYAD